MTQSSIPAVISDLVDSFGLHRSALAAELGVSDITFARWEKGASRPRPRAEGQLRHMHAVVAETRSTYRVPNQYSIELGGEQDVRRKIGMVLAQLREVFHRRGRFSGRRDALEEVSKLLFMYVTSIKERGQTLRQLVMTTGSRANTSVAASLIAVANDLLLSHLPRSLGTKLPPDRWLLALTPSEDALAEEVIVALDGLADSELVHAGGESIAGDLLNEVFGAFLGSAFTEEKEFGQYLTPTEVVRCMVGMAVHSLTPTDRAALISNSAADEFGLILDPCCGVGSFLAEFLRGIHSVRRQDIGTAGDDSWVTHMTGQAIIGIDKSDRMLQLAHVNLAMFGVPAARLFLGDSLSNEAKLHNLDGRVGLILTNPPFGAEVAPHSATQLQLPPSKDGLPNKINSEILFVERYLTWLRPGGQLIAVLPDSILTNQGLFAQLRSIIRTKAELLSVVSLPPNTFALAGTSTKTSILHLRKAPPSDRDRTFVAVCSDIGFKAVTRGATRRKMPTGAGDLPSILQHFTQNATAADSMDWASGLAQSDRWDAAFSLMRSGGTSADVCDEPKGSVADVCDLIDDRADPRRHTGTFKYIEISDVDAATSTVRAKSLAAHDAPSRARKRVRAGDVLVSTVRPDRRTVGVVDQSLDGAICTTGFAVLRPRNLSSYLVATVLRTDHVTAQLVSSSSGVAYPVVAESAILSATLPLKIEALRALSTHADGLFAEFTNARRRLSQWAESFPEPASSTEAI